MMMINQGRKVFALGAIMALFASSSLMATGDCFFGCGNPVNSFRDKDVLLMRSEIELPPLLACNGFLRCGHKTGKITCYKTIWFEVMKLPEIGQ